jgi:hypothetical protein
MPKGARVVRRGAAVALAVIVAGTAAMAAGSAGSPAAAGTRGSATAAAIASPVGPPGLGPAMDVPVRSMAMRALRISFAVPAGDSTLWAIAVPRASAGHAGIWHGYPFFGGLWYELGSAEALAVDRIGTPWAVVGTALTMFDGTSWRRVVQPDGTVVSGLTDALTITAGGTVVALSSGSLVVRWPSGVTTDIPGPPPRCLPWRLVSVGSDAVMWSGGAAGIQPRLGCLARRASDGTWSRVRPLGRDAPVWLLAAGGDDRLWAVLQGTVPASRAHRYDLRLWLVLLRGEETEVRTRAPGLVDSLVAADDEAWVLVSPLRVGPCSGRRSVLYRVSATGSWSVVDRRRLQAVTAVDSDGAAIAVTCGGGLVRRFPD